MHFNIKNKIDRFNECVLGKYEVYGGAFAKLAYNGISETASLVYLFDKFCESGYKNAETPIEIIDNFFSRHLDSLDEQTKINYIFRFIQYIERQVVLFDATEDAAYTEVNNMSGVGTLRYIKEEAALKNKTALLVECLENFSVHVVLTAHPTQFYPDSVLGIINDLTAAIRENNVLEIKSLLSQLGKTPFFNKQKPTPYDEAVSLIWYLDNVFYDSMGDIHNYIEKNIIGRTLNNNVLSLGFWPGGDRDGNPFVTSEITLQVARKLRSKIIRNYYRDMKKLRRKITFREVDTMVALLEARLYDNIFRSAENQTLSLDELKQALEQIRETIINKHDSLFLEEVNAVITKVNLFGFHFGTLDIRQDSGIHKSVIEHVVECTLSRGLSIFPKNYATLSEADQIAIIENLSGRIDPKVLTDEMAIRTLESVYAMRQIQSENGELGCNRYIISNSGSVLDLFHVLAFFKLSGWENPTVDVVPLFETIVDLESAAQTMEELYQNPHYIKHLGRRGNRQTIMLGFSDGTKDGGYLMANWSIYKAKENLTALSRKYNIKVLFFDGRGGPPARGGGKTHQFYSSLGSTIESDSVQLTVQGQTISSNFGIKAACQFNLEQLLSSIITNTLFSNKSTLDKGDRETLQELAEISYKSYSDFKSHPKFLSYLEKMSIVQYYAKSNIGSRPAKRGKSDEFKFSDLRAIPFVGSWSQLKQNVPGFYGLGTAISQLHKDGKIDRVVALYKNSLFFRTLVENSMMSLSKSSFGPTAYIQNDPEFGVFWQIIKDEFELTKAMLLKITGYKELMEDAPVNKASISIREKTVLPLITIQQYALMKIQMLKNAENADPKTIETYEKIVIRSLFGSINASRNSA